MGVLLQSDVYASPLKKWSWLPDFFSWFHMHLFKIVVLGLKGRGGGNSCKAMPMLDIKNNGHGCHIFPIGFICLPHLIFLTEVNSSSPYIYCYGLDNFLTVDDFKYKCPHFQVEFSNRTWFDVIDVRNLTQTLENITSHCYFPLTISWSCHSMGERNANLSL